MAKQRRGTGRRPSGRAVAWRLMGAFVLGVVVMGGGLYLLDHTRKVTERGQREMVERTAPAGGTAGGTAGSARPQAGAAEAVGGSPAIKAVPQTGAAVPQAPFGESEEVFETGARVYAARCAGCHGRPGATVGAAGQYWAGGWAGRRVAAEPAGMIYEQIAEGVPPGMQAYRGELRETEMWDVALLLRNAGQELPDPVVRLLKSDGGPKR